MATQASLLSARSSWVGGKYSLQLLSVTDQTVRSRTNSRNEFLIGDHILSLKVAEDDTLQLSSIRPDQELSHFFDGIFSGVLTGITIDSSADSGEGNTLHAVFDCQFQAASVAGSKERNRVLFPLVDWTDCVDHTLAGEIVGRGDLRIASVTSTKTAAFFN